MDVIKDINFTGDIPLNDSMDHYCLDLYLPCHSDTEHNETYRTVFKEINVLNGERTPKFDNTVSEKTEKCLGNELESECKENRIIKRNSFVIFIHGGGWRRGDRTAWKHYLYYDVNFLVSLLSWLFGTYGNVGESLALNGIPCVVMSYPLTELGMPWIFVELLTSYIQSCFVVFTSIFILVTVALLYRMSSDINTFAHWTYMHGRLNASHWKDRVLLIMLITNLVTACLFTFRRTKYNLSKTNVILLWSVIMVSSLPLTNCSTVWLGQIVFATFLSVQFTILRQRLKRSGRSVDDQVKVIAKAVRWVRTTCRDTTPYIYLMGHSAGGHLACLAAIEGSKLQSEECSVTNIKGVISVSGIYDVRCLDTPIIRRFYLHPTFGDKEQRWKELSPEYLVKRSKNQNRYLPHFLLISAEKDFFLKPQSWQFYKTLQETDIKCSHVEVKKTNHFSVITNFKHSLVKNDYSPISEVVTFILRHSKRSEPIK